jgi:hypothetical protein
MFLITLAATVLLAGADASATPAPAETAAPPAAAADKPQPKTRKVCYVEEGGTGSRVSRKHCVTEIVKDDTRAPDAPKTEQK